MAHKRRRSNPDTSEWIVIILALGGAVYVGYRLGILRILEPAPKNKAECEARGGYWQYLPTYPCQPPPALCPVPAEGFGQCLFTTPELPIDPYVEPPFWNPKASSYDPPIAY